jgi:hypothetical protein
MADAHTGTCFCGAVEIEVMSAPLEMGYCHCRSCRLYSGAPVSAYILWKSENGRFKKTEVSERQFCTRCGGHIMTYHPTFGLTDVRPAVIPSMAFKPALHLHYADTVLPMKDGLPKLKDFPTEAGGSGEVLPD